MSSLGSILRPRLCLTHSRAYSVFYSQPTLMHVLGVIPSKVTRCKAEIGDIFCLLVTMVTGESDTDDGEINYPSGTSSNNRM